MSTTKKHQLFVSEPLGEKSIDVLPGVGKTLTQRFVANNLTKAQHIVGAFLLLDQDREKFIPWFKQECGGNERHANMCFNALQQWCIEFIL